MVRGSEAVWFSDIVLITTSWRLSNLSITEMKGFGIFV